jgi:hypothetical protein
MKKRMNRILLFFVLLMQISMLSAQRPTHVPGSDGPVDIFESPASIIMYIIIPAIIIVLYLVWRRRIKKGQESLTKKPKENTGDHKQ